MFEERKVYTVKGFWTSSVLELVAYNALRNDWIEENLYFFGSRSPLAKIAITMWMVSIGLISSQLYKLIISESKSKLQFMEDLLINGKRWSQWWGLRINSKPFLCITNIAFTLNKLFSDIKLGKIVSLPLTPTAILFKVISLSLFLN